MPTFQFSNIWFSPLVGCACGILFVYEVFGLDFNTVTSFIMRIDREDPALDLLLVEPRERNEDHFLLRRAELLPDKLDSNCAESLLVSICADKRFCCLLCRMLSRTPGSSITTVHMSAVRGIISSLISRSSASVRVIRMDMSSCREESCAVSSFRLSVIGLLTNHFTWLSDCLYVYCLEKV